MLQTSSTLKKVLLIGELIHFCVVESLCANAGCAQACRVEDGKAVCDCQEGWILNADKINCDRKYNNMKYSCTIIICDFNIGSLCILRGCPLDEHANAHAHLVNIFLNENF